MTKTGAVVLRLIKYNDRTTIVDMLTNEYGRLAFAVSMGRSARSKVKRQLFQPAAQLEVEFDYRRNASLQRLVSVGILCPYTDISSNPYKQSLVMFLTEFLYYTTRSEQYNPALFNYVSTGFEWLDKCGGAFANFHIVFMLRLSRLLGFYPNIESHHEGRFFDLQSGYFVSVPPAHSDYLSAEESGKIALIMRMDYPTMHLFRMSHHERNRCVEIILRFYRLHIPDFPELKSVDVLKELFR